jgi:DNA polymerase III subunit delta'
LIRFADLIGQQLATSVLQRAIKAGTVNHAYLFTGPEGAGKTSTALAFAAALNCESPTPDGDACGTCTSCIMMAADGHPDIELIKPDGAQTKIKQMHEMRRMSQYAPVRGKWKVVIVEQVDTMNEDSSNSILKTLEEPPSYLIIILLSRNPALLLQTIRSRCLLVRFANAPAQELADALVDRFGASRKEAEFLAAYSEGRPGIAISLLGNEKFVEWREKVVSLATGIQSHSRSFALRLSEDFQKLTAADKEDNTSKRSATRMAIDSLILIYRDLLSLAVRGASAQLINSDMRSTLESHPIAPERATAGIETLLWARKALEGNANVQLLADVLMMRLMRE